jgi:hypothetical protein
MNTTQHRSAWGVALAAFALTMVTACGSEIATAPGSIGEGVDNNKPTAPRSSCFGSADYAERACADDGGAGTGPRTSGSGFGPQ